MPQKTQLIEVPFREVLRGEIYISSKTKRRYYGVKIIPTTFTNRPTNVALEFNAVVLCDHAGFRAVDGGSFISVNPDQIVEVDRPETKKGPDKRTLGWYEDNCVEIEPLEDGSIRFHFDDGSSDTVTQEQHQMMLADQDYAPR